MMRLIKKLGLITSGMVLLALSNTSFAQTNAGTTVSNLATLNFQVGGVAQTEIESSEAGNSAPGVGNGSATTFDVDRILDLTVTAIDVAEVSVSPGANNGTDETNSVALEFTVDNTGNARQNIALQAVNTANGLGSADNTAGASEVTSFQYYLDTNTNGVLDTGDTAIATATPGGSGIAVPVLTDQEYASAAVTVFVVAQIPTSVNVSAGDIAAISLVAAVAEPDTDDPTAGNLGATGALITTDDAATADTGAIEDVLADGTAGTAGEDGSFDFATGTANLNDGDDVISNGQHSDTSAYIVATADISVSKAVATVCDNTNLATNPKAIPGSIQRYTITVTNGSTSTQSATLTQLEDLIPTNTTLTVMKDYGGAPGATCAGFPDLSGATDMFRAGCTDAAGGATSRTVCEDANAGDYTYYAQAGGVAIDSSGTAAGNTITVCYDNQLGTGTGLTCSGLAATDVVLEADGGAGVAIGELGPDEAVVVEFDVIVQ